MMAGNVEFVSSDRCRTWRRAEDGTGKVVVVFDDFYHKRGAPQPYAWGLTTIARCLPEIDEVFALGFFDLPSKGSDANQLVNLATAWVQQCGDSARDVFVLVDMYFGDAEAATGPDVIKIIRDGGSLSEGVARIGILSVSGTPWDDIPEHPWLKDYPVFEKSSLKTELSKEFLDFLGVNDEMTRLWPLSVKEDGRRDYHRWFTVDHPVVPHNWSAANPQRVKEALGEYLEQVFGFSAPAHWLEGDELEHLHGELKYFVGSCSTCHTGGSRNLTLGGVLLLFGAAIRSQASELLSSVVWTEENTQNVILPNQSRVVARRAAGALVAKAGLFRSIARHDQTGHFIVSKVHLSKNAFTIEIELDPVDQWKPDKERTPLLRKVIELGEADGGTYGAYKRFVVASAEATTGKEARCVLNLKVNPRGGVNSTLLEFRRCAS